MSKAAVKLAASILAADFARLGEQVADVEQAGANRIHIDVMDGRFVPSITGGIPGIRWLRRTTHLPVEVHLMVLEPDLLVDEFAEAGADSLVVHWEGNTNLSRTVHLIKALGKRVGVAINPATPVSVLEEILQDLDQLLVLTVTPGLDHRDFMRSTLPKINYARELIDEINPACELAVEGGIDATTAPLVVDAGADVLVVGSAIFHDPEGVITAINRLRDSINRGVNGK